MNRRRRRKPAPDQKRWVATISSAARNRCAIEFGRRRNLQLIVLHVVGPVYYPVAGDRYGVVFDLSRVSEELVRGARAELSRLAGKLRARRVAARTLLSRGAARE